MLIDWFTVFAQTVNFLILVWLLKRFLYHPILNAIDARERRVAAALADAAAQRDEARLEYQAFQQKNEDFERQRRSLLAQAAEAAKSQGQALLEDARRDSEELVARRREALSKDFMRLREEILRRTRDEVFAIARRTLGDLASAGLEEQMVDAFVRRCRALTDQEKNVLRSSCLAGAEPVLVCSTFTLSDGLRETVERTVREVLACDGEVRFETGQDLLCGIEVSVNGQEVAWSIAGYLAGLENNIGELLQV